MVENNESRVLQPLPTHAVGLSETQRIIVDFAIQAGPTRPFSELLDRCTSPEQKRAIIGMVLIALDVAPRRLVGPGIFNSQMRKLVRLDKENVGQLLTDWVYSEEEADAERGRRICARMSLEVSEGPLECFDKEWCSARKIAGYLRNKSSDVWYLSGKAKSAKTPGGAQMWGGKVEAATDDIAELLDIILERDDEENGFLEEVIGVLRAGGYLSRRGDKEISYLENVLRGMASGGDDGAAEMLKMVWLDGDDAYHTSGYVDEEG